MEANLLPDTIRFRVEDFAPWRDSQDANDIGVIEYDSFCPYESFPAMRQVCVEFLSQKSSSSAPAPAPAPRIKDQGTHHSKLKRWC